MKSIVGDVAQNDQHLNKHELGVFAENNIKRGQVVWSCSTSNSNSKSSLKLNELFPFSDMPKFSIKSVNQSKASTIIFILSSFILQQFASGSLTLLYTTLPAVVFKQTSEKLRHQLN